MARISLALGLLLLVALSEVYEVQGTFLLRHYLRKIPRRNRDFRPFACRGMLKFVDLLQSMCPLKPQYTSFFGNLKSYMNFINTASGSKNFDSELKGKAQGLFSAMSALSGKGGSSADSSNLMETLMSMGKTLGHQQESSSMTISSDQRKELILSMAKWAKTIGQFVASAAAKNGNNIDISSLGLDIDASASVSGDSIANSGTSGGYGTSGGTLASGTGPTSGGTTATGTDTTSGGTTATGTGITSGGTTATATGITSGGTTATGTDTTSGGTTAIGSSGKFGSGGTTTGGSPTSGCTTGDCSNGGRNSFKAAMNFQHGGNTASQSQQTTSSQQGANSDGSS